MIDGTFLLIATGSAIISLYAMVRPRHAMFLIIALSLFTGPFKMLLDIRETPLILDFGLVAVLLSFLLREHVILRKPLILPRFSAPILLLFLICIAQMFNPEMPNLQVALEGFRITAFYMIAFFAARYTITSKEDLLFFMKMLVGCSVVVAIYGIRQHYFPFEGEIAWAETIPVHMFWGTSYNNRTMRVFSTFNGLGAHWLFIPLSVLTHIALYNLTANPRTRLFILISLGLFIISSLFSLGRGAWLATAFGTVVMLMFLDVRQKGRVLLLASFILLCAASYSKFLPETEVLGARFETMRNLENDSGVMHRFDIMANALEWIPEHPFGRGTGLSSNALFARYDNVVTIGSHNQFLDVAIELGIAPALLYLYLIAASIFLGIRLSWKTKDKTIKVAATWLLGYNIGFLAFSLEGQVFGFPQSLHFWFLLGVLANLERLASFPTKPKETHPTFFSVRKNEKYV